VWGGGGSQWSCRVRPTLMGEGEGESCDKEKTGRIAVGIEMDGRTREDREERGWKERKDVHMSEKPSLRVTVSVSVREGVS